MHWEEQQGKALGKERRDSSMAQKINVSPLTRIEGHLKIEVEIDKGKIVDAHCAGEMFRGWEIILKGRHPLDAQQITQRICGVCPTSHGQASTRALDDAFGITPPDNGRILRNLILGADYIQSHILHFYHLAALDYVDITAILNYQGNCPKLNKVKSWAQAEAGSGRSNALSPFMPRYKGDYIEDQELNIAAISHYLEALELRKKAHEALTLFAGKTPHAMAVLPGGVTEKPTVDKIAAYLSYMKELSSFVEKKYIPDVIAVAKGYPQYFGIGKGPGNFLSYGTFEENNEGTEFFLTRGVVIKGSYQEFDKMRINEYVGFSKYKSESGLHPWDGKTEPDVEKEKSYSFIKAPRYEDAVMEVGPLARTVVAYMSGKNGAVKSMIDDTCSSLGIKVSDLFSVLGRHAARALECKRVAERCLEWVMEIKPGEPVHTPFTIPGEAEGVGFAEAPRGAVSHWIKIDGQVIDLYQVVAPTTWNCSPRDDKGQLGALEQALVGTPVADVENPIEPARVVRSFDP
jgi:Ni,Fe-hydrogenase I large subunit